MFIAYSGRLLLLALIALIVPTAHAQFTYNTTDNSVFENAETVYVVPNPNGGIGYTDPVSGITIQDASTGPVYAIAGLGEVTTIVLPESASAFAFSGIGDYGRNWLVKVYADAAATTLLDAQSFDSDIENLGIASTVGFRAVTIIDEGNPGYSSYYIEDLAFTALPEPSTGLLGLLVVGASIAVLPRRRMSRIVESK